ncbi:urea amidolyase associated protein UAAP1 [Alcanivorax sp.]|uniref:urea amidolyase associated protein UAAP1 n=1 Tax=Alcanivorax sp. TaxID=1872427 RepID=UPI000C38D9E4|nr:urea amidolyase associated protein UAAP1 [Alcanivorax sp.]MBU83191.1 urea carboxylase [Alcanivorax sp.]MEE3388705.1 urea amidolyase associated protein UAAP1 [Pseudomonadota bacterium]|tara:strand:- start:143 stop:859 length:717 start_codon:yes stop_codon:yes gene_type:complete
MNESLYTTLLPGSAHWSLRVRRGMQLRFTDQEGGANLSVLMYNPEMLLERYNAPDSLKGQHTFKLSKGNCLYSDMGRVFASIVEDDFGWHDTVCGTLSEKTLKEKYAVRSYQDCHNQWTLSGEHSFLTELAKYGLTERDMAANLNLFSRVTTDDDGNLVFDTSAATPGASITLRFEMDTLVILHTCPHPLNPSEEYPMKPVQIEMRKADPVADDDYCKNFRPENGRAFENNRLYHLGL